jgi:hypothetical protein
MPMNPADGLFLLQVIIKKEIEIVEKEVIEERVKIEHTGISEEKLKEIQEKLAVQKKTIEEASEADKERLSREMRKTSNAMKKMENDLAVEKELAAKAERETARLVAKMKSMEEKVGLKQALYLHCVCAVVSLFAACICSMYLQHVLGGF